MPAGQSFTLSCQLGSSQEKKQGKKPKKMRKKLKGIRRGIASKCREVLKPTQKKSEERGAKLVHLSPWCSSCCYHCHASSGAAGHLDCGQRGWGEGSTSGQEQVEEGFLDDWENRDSLFKRRYYKCLFCWAQQNKAEVGCSYIRGVMDWAGEEQCWHKSWSFLSFSWKSKDFESHKILE